MRSLWIAAVVVVTAGTALAHPPPPPREEIGWRETPAWFEFSSWIGFGVGAARDRPDSLARTTTQPQPTDQHLAWSFDAGVDVTVPITHAVRFGPWIGLQGLEPMVGAEVSVTRAPAEVDMFWYRGEGVWTLRGGGGRDHATAAIGWGYRCPWKLWGPYARTTRYEIGARIILNVNRAYADPADWSTTLGIEFEPVGAIRYVLGIKSWY
jgi:hypothetical protein